LDAGAAPAATADAAPVDSPPPDDEGLSGEAGVDGGMPPPDPDAALPPAGSDAGCPALLPPDAGVCTAYGCHISLDQLGARAQPTGACSSAPAVAAACDGSADSAALRCTEASVFAADLSAAVNACMEGDPSLGELGTRCRGCFADNALCALSRCLVACALAMETGECQACRRERCGAQLTQCTGLPAP